MVKIIAPKKMFIDPVNSVKNHPYAIKSNVMINIYSNL